MNIENKNHLNDFKSITDIDLLYNQLSLGYLPNTTHFMPILNSKAFAEYCFSKDFKKEIYINSKWSSSINYNGFKPNEEIRKFTIPMPDKYYNICYSIYSAWDIIKKRLNINWKNDNTYSLLTFLDDEKRIMNQSVDKNKELELFLNKAEGKEFIVHMDISSFFHSIYLHSITWAGLGKVEAKKEFKKRKNASKEYKLLDGIDKSFQKSQNGHTLGVPIGIDSSNIISELLLSNIDNNLINNGFEFIRYIDDFYCYANNKDDVDKFKRVLTSALDEYGLNINSEKTICSKIPYIEKDIWSRELRRYNIDIKSPNDFYKIQDFINLSIEFSEKYNISSPIKYSINKILSELKKIDGKEEFKDLFINFEKYFLNICLSHPLVSEKIFDIFDLLDFNNIDYLEKSIKRENVLNNLLKKGMQKNNEFLICVSLFNFILKKEIEFTKINDLFMIADKLGCISLVSLLILIKIRFNDKYDASLKKIANNIIINDNIEENWIFIYELYLLDILSDKDLDNESNFDLFKDLKKNKVSFLEKKLYFIGSLKVNLEGDKKDYDYFREYFNRSMDYSKLNEEEVEEIPF